MYCKRLEANEENRCAESTGKSDIRRPDVMLAIREVVFILCFLV